MCVCTCSPRPEGVSTYDGYPEYQEEEPPRLHKFGHVMVCMECGAWHVVPVNILHKYYCSTNNKETI